MPTGHKVFVSYCPIPLIARFEARIMSWDEHLERDAEDIRLGASGGRPVE
jgi:hypothetical protein